MKFGIVLNDAGVTGEATMILISSCMKNALMWFRKDLRLHDNPALAAACKADHILPVWILPQRELEPNPLLRGVLGSDAPAKMGPGRQ